MVPADNYREYLAARILSGGKPITYRLLSRALKVNVNTAKQMLYEFYTKQNAKKPKSIHATYLLTGTKREEEEEHTNGANGQDGDDTVMRSSPYMSSMPEPDEDEEEDKPVPTTTIEVVRDEELEDTKKAYESIATIHIYSLEPGPIEDLRMLSVCNQEVTSKFAAEDPLERWRVYGCIHNPYVKRRMTKYNPGAPKALAEAIIKPTPATAAAKTEEASGPARRGSGSEANTSGRSTLQPGQAPSLKRSNSKTNPPKNKTAGDLFKSFAKAKPKAKEAEKSKESTPALTEDEQMQGMSEDEGDAEEPQVKFDEEKATAARKAREEREDKLKRMMEEDDEDMPDAPPAEEKDSQDEPLDKVAASKSEESEATVTVQGGRRRGRRRVMKKKKVKDEDGYLVTKEEAVWESFSEDEPEPKKPKPAPKPAAAAKGKAGAKKGQGSIANFFKKA